MSEQRGMQGRTPSEHREGHATVAQLRAVLAELNDDDCVHANALGNLSVMRPEGTDLMGYWGFIAMANAEQADPGAVLHPSALSVVREYATCTCLHLQSAHRGGRCRSCPAKMAKHTFARLVVEA